MAESSNLRLARRSVLRAGVCWFCAAALPAGARAASAPPARAVAEEIIRRTVERVFVVLRDPALAREPKRRMQRLREIVDEVFDWVTMATSSLGHHWNKLSDAERREFVSVFKELLAQRYMKDIDRFQGSEQVLLRGSDTVEDLITVKTVLVTNSREQVPIDYVMQSLPAGPRVIDFAIEGVSLDNHYRATFDRFLVNNAFAELLAQLKRKLGLT